MTQAIIIITVVLFLIAMFLLYKVQVLSGILKGSDDEQESSTNNWMGIMLFGFYVVGISCMFYYASVYWDQMNIPIGSVHGEELDNGFWLSMTFIISAMVITNFLLMLFAFLYRFKKSRKATFYPDNHKLEFVWTIIPAAVLSVLIFTGWKSWSGVMDKAPSDVIKVEIRGEQFAWKVRYPGADNEFGKIDYRRIDGVNEFGMFCEDPASADDFFATKEIHLPVGKPVLFKIRAKDVIHSVFAPHFRVKMDAVPGMPTKFWFTPAKTTKQMEKELREQGKLAKNPDGSYKPFKYEIVCAEVCGKSHFGMRKVIIVETEEEYKKWLSEQVPFFEKNPDVCSGGDAVVSVPVVEETSATIETDTISTSEVGESMEVQGEDSEGTDSEEVVVPVEEEVEISTETEE